MFLSLTNSLSALPFVDKGTPVIPYNVKFISLWPFTKRKKKKPMTEEVLTPLFHT
jgi:hypothetical protein